jgi:tetratricopeptide (TPR) repeat protein
MGDQARMISTPPPVPALSNNEYGIAAYLDRYRQALDTFDREPKALLLALGARDRIDVELRRRAARGDSPQPLDEQRYRLQLGLLVEKIDRDHPSYSQALLYQHRLSENLDQTQRYGDTETLRAERARIIDQLNSLALSALGVPFTDLANTEHSSANTAVDDISDRLVELDHRLRQQAFRREDALAHLVAWRNSLGPPEEAWWWRLDQEFKANEQANNLPWYVVAAILMTISLSLSIEIIRRFWSGTPDVIAIFGTVLTLLLTASPLLKHGPDLAQWALRRSRWFSPRFRGEAVASMAGLALLLVLVGWFCLPVLGTFYNNRGKTAQDAGHLSDAEQLFQRATALNPGLPVPYYNLADLYERSGSPEDAITWYRRSIEHNRQFRAAYYGLGSLYNQQGQFAKAERILLAGLNITSTLEDQRLANVNNYILLSNLGWTLFAQGRFEPAQEMLQKAVQLEGAIGPQERQMLPHYYLARVYCRLQRPADAVHEIEETLRFGNPVGWEYQIWNATANDYLKAVKAGASACETMPSMGQ